MQQPKQPSLKNVKIQPKLQVNEPGDSFEQEADAMADRVMSMSGSATSSRYATGIIGKSVQRKCAHCEEEEKKKQVMRKPQYGSGGNAVSSSFASTLQTSKGGGASLPSGTRSVMENAFGTDFSAVRIHTGRQASELNNSIQARAFTYGNDIYFNDREYASDTYEGKKLLAHELTHVVQQQNGLVTRLIQRTSYATQLQGFLAQVNPIAGVGNFPAAYGLLNSLNATDMLDTLAGIEQLQPHSIDILIGTLAVSPPLSVNINRLNAYLLAVKNALYQNDMSPTELQQLTTNIAALPLDQQQTIHQFTSSHRSAVTRDLYTGAHIPTAIEQGAVETVFNPGATTTVSATTGAVTVTAPTQAAVCANAANFEARIRQVLVPTIQSEAHAFRLRQAAPATFPIAQATTMADLAQREVERYFEPYLARASRSSSATAYRLGGSTHASSLLRDQSTAYSRLWNSTAGRLLWLKYWYDHLTNNMNDTLHCNNTQIEAALTPMANDTTTMSADGHNLQTDIGDYINSWSAEATGGINLQPYLSASNLVCQRWDTFTTIIHEFIHLLAHPNFENAGGQLENTPMEILKEGLDDVLRKELWEGAGHLRTDLISPARNADRAIVEGAANPLDITKVCSHNYYDNLPDAESITTAVGINNVKLAYFLGQTEYLGLGISTIVSPGHSLSGLSFYSTADPLSIDLVPVIPGETRDQLLLRTNGTEIRDTGNTVIAPGTALPASVRIPGVRFVYVHTDDSLTSIAVQNGVTPYEIMRANNLTTASVSPGGRLLIPRH